MRIQRNQSSGLLNLILKLGSQVKKLWIILSSELEDDTSDCCQKNVDRDFNTDTPNVKDPMIGGKLPADAQPSDYEEQDDIPIFSRREMLEGKSAEKKKKWSYSPAMTKTDQILL